MEIEIKGECYSLNEIPLESSGAVTAEKERLLGAIDLNSFVCDLGRIGNFIRIACIGVRAAGYKNTKEEIEVQQLGYDIMKLFSKSTLIVTKFKSSALINLHCIYGYLFDNLEEMALEKLSSVSKLAEEMEKGMLELHNDFVAEERKVITTLETIQNAKLQASMKVQKDEHAVDTLHDVVDSLKHISVVMMYISIFWRETQPYCSSLHIDINLKPMIERAMKYPEDKRMKI